jgi:hypothetical protein
MISVGLSSQGLLAGTKAHQVLMGKVMDFWAFLLFVLANDCFENEVGSAGATDHQEKESSRPICNIGDISAFLISKCRGCQMSLFSACRYGDFKVISNVQSTGCQFTRSSC